MTKTAAQKLFQKAGMESTFMFEVHILFQKQTWISLVIVLAGLSSVTMTTTNAKLPKMLASRST